MDENVVEPKATINHQTPGKDRHTREVLSSRSVLTEAGAIELLLRTQQA